MEWFEFSDIIGLAIVFYVSVLALNNYHLRKDIKSGILFSGICLAILYVFDFSWYVIYYKVPVSAQTDFVLNLVTCIVYLMIPVGLSSFFFIYAFKTRKLRRFIGLATIMVLAIADIVNIFKPIIFYHKDSIMYFEPFGLCMHILCFVAFVIVLGDMIRVTTFDYEDMFLAAFVGVTMFIGLLASWINYDMKTLWISLGISYLLMYLAMSELYNKKDVITELPNRNAYEKAMVHIKDNYNTLLMIDMNGLKQYNDTMGHQTGDQYIYATARTLSDAFADYGRFYRVGGDEFCLVSKHSPKELTNIVESLLLNGKCNEKYGDFTLDFAYGIGERLMGDSPYAVYQKADKLMYENKKSSKKSR